MSNLLLNLAGGNFFGLAISPDGTRLATGGADRTGRLFDISPGSERNPEPLTLHGSTLRISAVIFRPDGKRLASASRDSLVRIYVLPLADIVAISKSRVTRGLTLDECRKFLRTKTCPDNS
jgi:WD40 repeat protein